MLAFLVLRLEGDLVMSLGLMNFVGLFSGKSRQLTITGGAQELLPIGYYLENLNMRLMT